MITNETIIGDICRLIDKMSEGNYHGSEQLKAIIEKASSGGTSPINILTYSYNRSINTLLYFIFDETHFNEYCGIRNQNSKDLMNGIAGFLLNRSKAEEKGTKELVDWISLNESCKTIFDDEYSLQEVKEKIGNVRYSMLNGEQDIGLNEKQLEALRRTIDFLCDTNNVYEKEGNRMSVEERLDILINKKKRKQIILTGAPGTGKTYSILRFVEEWIKNYLKGRGVNNPTEEEIKRYYKFVQFHPSYDYSDFVEGLRPVQLGGEGSSPTFVRMDGTFKSFCRNIVKRDEKDAKYFFIIDEINRADLSKVFGELMFGLETSYREKKFDTQYMNLKTYEIREDAAKPINSDVFKEGFFIPQNLIIIGTMNNIDRSVESFDFALRRRFYWEDIKAIDVAQTVINGIIEKYNEDPKDEKIPEDDISTLSRGLEDMNNVFSKEEFRKFGLTEDYYIGPAYLKEYDGKNLPEIFGHEIEPILREYTRGRNKEDIDKFVSECAKKMGLEKGNTANDWKYAETTANIVNNPEQASLVEETEENSES